MLTWEEFKAARPDLAEAGRDLLYQFGVGLALLATVRKDGGPRVHPMCPVISGSGLYAWIEPSGPKRFDLERDGRYAMHGYPPNTNEDAFYITGRASRVDDEDVRASVREVFWRERGKDAAPVEAAGQVLFEFLIETCLLTRTTGHGDWNPQHTIFKA
jgi:hypothetical protein